MSSDSGMPYFPYGNTGSDGTIRRGFPDIEVFLREYVRFFKGGIKRGKIPHERIAAWMVYCGISDLKEFWEVNRKVALMQRSLKSRRVVPRKRKSAPAPRRRVPRRR